MNTTKNTIMKQLPQFSSSRCKRCGICSHFCPVHAIDTCDGGLPYLADSAACTSCGLCRDMCPDWAVSLEPTAVELPDGEKPARVTAEAPGNGAGSLEAVPASGD